MVKLFALQASFIMITIINLNKMISNNIKQHNRLFLTPEALHIQVEMFNLMYASS